MSQPLKEQYRWQLWLVVATNCLWLYWVVQTNASDVSSLGTLFTDTSKLLPMGSALMFVTVLNGLLSAETKARLVFLRWHNALPGHRAFSRYAKRDPRIDLVALEEVHGSPLPNNPDEENRVWHRMYKTVQHTPAVLQAHRDFLLLRDYTALAALFVIIFGAVGLYAINSWRSCMLYVVMLIGQYLIVRHAAARYGTRMVTTVLAEKGATNLGHET